MPISPAWADIDGEQHSAFAPDLGADETSSIQITKRGPTQAYRFEPITYTITVTNVGVSVRELAITDTLPHDASYVSGGTLVNGTIISWTQAAPLATDAVLTRTFIVTATEAITNTDYRVTAGSGAFAVGTDIVTTEMYPSNLQITKTGPISAVPNAEIIYTLIITNTGSRATSLIITDTLPIGATYVRGGTLVGDLVRWDVHHLNHGKSLERTFTVTATQTITNYDYGVTGNGGDVYALGTDTVTTVISPALHLSKTGPSTATAGADIEYTLTVTNTGGLAKGVVITDRVPNGATYVSGGTFVDPIVTCDIGDLAYQQTVQCLFIISATQTITNDTYGVSAINSTILSGTDAVSTIIAPQLSIDKTAPITATAGSEITYTLTVTNTGGLATGVVITDQLPINATFVRAGQGGGLNAGVLTWPAVTLSYTASIQRTFTVTATQTITNAQYGARADGGYRTFGPLPIIVKID